MTMPAKTLSVLLVTGPSGCGKSTALHALEDLGYLCVDNLPPTLLEQLVETLATSTDVQRLAVVIDVRALSLLHAAPDALKRLRGRGNQVNLLYLVARDGVLLRRFSETRRPHPLDRGEGLSASLLREKSLLEPLAELSDQIVDTSELTPHALRRNIREHFGCEDTTSALRLTVTSFGFKHGIPLDASLVFDVRFLSNPHFVPGLKALTGLDEDVRDYVFADPSAHRFVERTFDYVQVLLPEFVREGKHYLDIAIGCTGGQHRSVAIAAALAASFENIAVPVWLRHRDIGRTRSTSEELL